MALETLIYLTWRLYLAIPLMALGVVVAGGGQDVMGQASSAPGAATLHSYPLDGGLPGLHSRAGTLWHRRSLGLASHTSSCCHSPRSWETLETSSFSSRCGMSAHLPGSLAGHALRPCEVCRFPPAGILVLPCWCSHTVQ